MKKLLAITLLAFAANFAFGITATKAYVDGATNATLVAANQYTDAHGGGVSSNQVVAIVDDRANRSITTAVDNQMKAILGDDWKTTYGTGLAGIIAAIVAALTWLKSNKRDKTDNTCHATASGFSRWRATLPTDHEWDDQPTFSDTLDNWVWGSSTEDVEGDSSDPEATSVTFSYTVEGETKSFTATRTAAQPATEGKTFVTQDYADTQGVHATDHIGAGVWLMETPYVAPTLSRDANNRVVVDTATVFSDGTFELEGTVTNGAIAVDV